MSDAFDFIVLGAGSGGLAAAFRAARHGARVALLEPGPPGGTCVNVGCVPKKAMWYAAEAAVAQERALDYGFASRPGELDWDTFVARRRAYIERIHDSYRRRLHEAGIEYVAAAGSLLDAGTVAAGTRRLTAPHVLLATGAAPRRLALPGFELGMVSDGFFALRRAPARVAVIGGGYIGVELAGIYRALGAQVDLYSRGTLLHAFDAEVVAVLAEIMRGRGIVLHTDCPVRALERRGDDLAVLCEHGDVRCYDAVQWAVGRVPNSAGLGLEALGVAGDETGHVRVDGQQCTGVDGVYAVGDVTAGRALTPVAIAAGRQLADRLFAGIERPPLREEVIPSVLFAHPPLGTVGLTEAQARERHGDAVSVHRSRFTPMPQALGSDPQPALVKLVCAGVEQRVLGLHVLGPGADEMLQGFAVAVAMGARKADFDATVAIHPTAAEELVLL